jgi:hypothetical protein
MTIKSGIHTGILSGIKTDPLTKFGGGGPLDIGKSLSIYATSNQTQNVNLADASQTGLQGIVDDMTIECWVKATNTGGLQALVMRDLVSSTNYNFLLLINGASSGLYWRRSSVTKSITGANPLAVGTWVHYAVTRNKTTGQGEIYVNGVNVSSPTTGDAGFSADTGAGTLYLGRQDQQASWRYKGLMTEVRIWSVERTAAEIAANYNTTLTGNETGLEAYYRMDDDLTDSSPNENDLTNSSSPVAVIDSDTPL